MMDVTHELRWMKELFSECGFKSTYQIRWNCDNQAVIINNRTNNPPLIVMDEKIDTTRPSRSLKIS